MDSYKLFFGRSLKKIRKSKNYTQEKFAEKIGINLRQLARIEAGESFVTAETLQKICNELCIKPSILFDFDETCTENNPENESYNKLKNRILNIAEDENKIYFVNTAIDALKDRNSIEKLKLLIKGLELSFKTNNK